MRVAIVGFGRFGRLLALLLHEHHPALDVVITSRSDYRADADKLGLVWLPFADAARADVVVLCVPIREMFPAVAALRDVVIPGSVVMDTCSVKMQPAAVMKDGLPSSVHVLGSHPLFGPDGVREFGLAGQRFVSCPVRISEERLDLVEGWFRTLGVRVLRMTPEEHDRQAAIAQGLVHFIGRAVARAGFREQAVTTNNAQHLFGLARSVEADTLELFRDLEIRNPFAVEVRQAFMKAAAEIEAELTAG